MPALLQDAIFIYYIVNKIKRRLYNKHALLKNVAMKKFLF